MDKRDIAAVPKAGAIGRSIEGRQSRSPEPLCYPGPFITIAIPTYNRASLLKECLDAALAQSYQNFEVLVSNNASTDSTLELLSKISEPRLRVITQPKNVGIIDNCNACLSAARGEYVIFVPDDDRIEHRSLERFVAVISMEPDIPIVVALCDLYLVEEGRLLPATKNVRLRTGPTDGIDLLKEFLNRRLSVQMCSVMLRAEALRARGGFLPHFQYAFDAASWMSMLLAGRVGFVNEACGTFRQHRESATSQLAVSVQLDENEGVIDLLQSLAERLPLGKEQGRDIRRAANRYVAGRTLETLAEYRKKGGRFWDIVPMIWHRRRRLMALGLADLHLRLRPIAILLLPQRVTKLIRGFMRSFG